MSTASRSLAPLARWFMPLCITLSVGCAATPCPPAEPVPQPPAVEPKASPAPPPAELRGEFSITVAKDTAKGETVDFSAVAKKSGAGEFMVGFTSEGVALSAWNLSHYTSDKEPDHKLYTLCRGRLEFQPTWRGKTMILASKLEVKGFSDGLDVQVRKEDNKTTTSRVLSSGGCTFSFDAGEYTIEIVASDAQGPTSLRITLGTTTFELVRSTSVTELDIKAIVDSTKAK